MDSDIIDRSIAVHPTHREKMTTVRGEDEGRTAQTFYRVAERFRGFAAVQAIPKTGRTHQIRVHLAHVGLPVLCDRAYGHRRSCRAASSAATRATRQYCSIARPCTRDDCGSCIPAAASSWRSKLPCRPISTPFWRPAEVSQVGVVRMPPGPPSGAARKAETWLPADQCSHRCPVKARHPTHNADVTCYQILTWAPLPGSGCLANFALGVASASRSPKAHWMPAR